MASRSKEFWLETGLESLAQQGPQSLTIESLCRATGKTKGSFYHHFSGAQEFARQVTEFWRQSHTQDLIDLTTGLPPEQALQRLRELAKKLPFARESAFRAWAASDEQAAKAVAEVDSTRVRHLAELYAKLGHDADQAESMAWLEYALSLGLAQLKSSLPRGRGRRAQELFERRIIT